MTDHCFGCNAIVFKYPAHELNYCNWRKNNTHGQCPCTACVVKPMCNNTCRKFFAWRDYLVAKENLLTSMEDKP